MERIATSELRQADLARTLLILSNYEWIQQQAEAVGVSIVPLKGIDLLQTVYSERLDRPVRDIDLLCHTEDDCRRLAEQLCLTDEYRLEFPFSLRPEALAAKHKVSLLSCSTTKVNVDIHTAFVTKKFFAQTIGTFNADALQRCHDGHMESTDRWLFLAQHAAFHLYADPKWVHDLQVLYEAFTPEQRNVLTGKALRYGFQRILTATQYHIAQHSSSPTPQSSFLRFIAHFNRPFSRRPFDRLVASYWEFVFIDRSSQRWRMWLQLMFPSHGMLTNIYRIRRPMALLLFYPLNILVAGLTSLLFWTIYLFKS